MFKLEQKKIYNENDISIMLYEVQENEQTKSEFSKLIDKFATGRDKGVLHNALENFVGGEQFTRYDSDVCEQFIRLYEKFRGWK